MWKNLREEVQEDFDSLTSEAGDRSLGGHLWHEEQLSLTVQPPIGRPRQRGPSPEALARAKARREAYRRSERGKAAAVRRNAIYRARHPDKERARNVAKAARVRADWLANGAGYTSHEWRRGPGKRKPREARNLRAKNAETMTCNGGKRYTDTNRPHCILWLQAQGYAELARILRVL